MFFSNNRSRLKPRRFEYQPMIYNPEDEEQGDSKIDFRQYQSRTRKNRKKSRSPLFYLIIIILIIMIMKYLNPEQLTSEDLNQVQLSEDEIVIFSSDDAPTKQIADSLKAVQTEINPE